jgi:uncharacterized membrane protein
MSEEHTQETSSGTQGSAPAPGHQKNTLMAVLAYIGPLVIVSYLTAKDDPFVKFHIKQGLVLFVIEVAMWFLAGMMFYQFWMIMNIINLATLVLSIVGIVNAVQGQEKELPLVGQFSKHFPI